MCETGLKPPCCVHPARAILSGLVALVASLAGCRLPEEMGTPENPGDFVFLVPAYGVRAPGDIAVLPVYGPVFAAPATDPVWAPRLRDRLYWGLLRKGYAPLDPGYVDRELGDLEVAPGQGTDLDVESLARALPVDGFLLARVDRLDLTTYQDSGRAVVAGELQLWDGKAGIRLWTARRQLKLAPTLSRGSRRPDQSFGEAAIERFLLTCLDQLPGRTRQAEGGT